MQGLTLQRAQPPLLASVDSLPCVATVSRVPISRSLRCREIPRLKATFGNNIRSKASNFSVGSGGYEERREQDEQKIFPDGSPGDKSSHIVKPPNKIPYPLSIAMVLLGCALVYSLIVFVRGEPSAILAAISKSGLTAAFTLIFVSEIGDKTFFIAALLAMQYEKGLEYNEAYGWMVVIMLWLIYYWPKIAVFFIGHSLLTTEWNAL